MRELVLVLLADTVGVYTSDPKNKARIHTEMVRTLAAEGLFICMSLVAVLFLILVQGCEDNENVPLLRFLKFDMNCKSIYSVPFFIAINYLHYYL
jgi:hypothetical protein